MNDIKHLVHFTHRVNTSREDPLMLHCGSSRLLPKLAKLGHLEPAHLERTGYADGFLWLESACGAAGIILDSPKEVYPTEVICPKCERQLRLERK